MVTSLDYVGIWLEPLALSMDPLFVQWLAYRPILKPQTGAYTFYITALPESHNTKLKKNSCCKLNIETSFVISERFFNVTDLSQQFTYTKTMSSPSYLMSRRRITPPVSYAFCTSCLVIYKDYIETIFFYNSL